MERPIGCSLLAALFLAGVSSAGLDGVVEGRVTDSAGNAIEGAAVLVDLGTWEALTDSDGCYRITGVGTGIHLLRALVPGAFGVPADIVEGVEVPEGSPVTVDFVIEGYPRPLVRIVSITVPEGWDSLEIRGAVEDVLADSAGRFEELADSLCGSGPGISFPVAFGVSFDESGGVTGIVPDGCDDLPRVLVAHLGQVLEAALVECPQIGPGPMTVELEFGR